MVTKKDLWSLISTVIISTVMFNFGLKYATKANPELMDIILGSTKLERFAEALGYYTPVAAPDAVTINEDSGPSNIDVLDNDSDTDYDGGTGSAAEKLSLLHTTPTPISNISGDTGATVIVDSVPTGTNDTAAGPSVGTTPTAGEITVNTSQNYQGSLTFDYTMCDSDPVATSGDEDGGSACGTAQVDVIIAAVNDRPEVNDFAIQTNQGVSYAFANGGSPTLFEDNFRDQDQIFLDNNPGAVASTSEGYTFHSLQVWQLPQKGTLVLDDGTTQTNITAFQVIPIADVPNITYIPDPQESGSDTFRWSANDSVGAPIFPDSIELQNQPTATQTFESTAFVNITINPAEAPTNPNQTLTIKRGQTLAFDPINASQNGTPTLTGLTVDSLPTNASCAESTPGVSGNVITCTAPISAPLGNETFTVTATNDLNQTSVATYTLIVEDFVAPIVTLVTDTPPEEVEIDKQVCAIAYVQNTNDFDLENVVVRLVTDDSRAPFVLGTSAVTKGDIQGTSITEAMPETSFTIPILASGDTNIMQSCALPKTTDISFIDATSFVTGSDKITNANVQLDPPENEETGTPLVRTGGKWASTIQQLTIIEGFITVLIWMYYKTRNKKKE